MIHHLTSTALILPNRIFIHGQLTSNLDVKRLTLSESGNATDRHLGLDDPSEGQRLEPKNFGGLEKDFWKFNLMSFRFQPFIFRYLVKRKSGNFNTFLKKGRFVKTDLK